MDCEWTWKVSALVDGELNEEDARRLREHLAACGVCRQAESEFLILRREIQSYTVEDKHAMSARALHKIFSSENVPLWKRRIALPMPALALLLLAALLVGVWVISVRRDARDKLAVAQREEKRQIARPVAAESGASEIDLARFDHGGRAVIYKMRRENLGDVNQ